MARLDGQRLSSLMLTMLEVLKANRIGRESYRDTFLRLVGMQPNINVTATTAQAGDTSTRTEEQLLEASKSTTVAGQDGKTLVDGFLKRTDENAIQLRKLAGSYINQLLSIVEQWSRVERGQQARRLQRLVGGEELAILPEITLELAEKNNNESLQGTFDIISMVQDINTGLKGLKTSELNKTVGSLALKDNFFQLLLTQITALIASVPAQEIGAFGGVFVKTLKSPLIGVDVQAKKISAERRAIQVELSLLQQQASLIVEGVAIRGVDNEEHLSLKQILKALSVLTADVSYQCRECVFYDTENGASRCLFATDNGIGKEVLDVKGNPAPSSTCKEIWGLNGNDYWTASEETISKVVAALNFTEEA